MQDSMRYRFVLRQASLRHAPLLRLALLASGLLAAPALFAQTQPATAPATTHPKIHAKKHGASPSPAAPVAPPVAPAPNWPINDQPNPASVSWNQQQLRIDASNASLQQILDKVSTETGSTIEGLTKDERVFGGFGPASVRDVLSQLLHGTGYNVLMIGDQGQGAPRQIILSARNTSKTPNSTTRTTPEDEEDAIDTQYEPPPPQQFPQPIRPGIGPDGAPVRMPPQLQQQPQGQPQPGQPQPGQSQPGTVQPNPQ
jgi:hypothetical protein